MTPPTTPSGMKTVIYPVSDLSAAKQLYGALLGAAPVMDEPYYVGYQVCGYDIGLDPNGHAKGFTCPVGYWNVDNIDAALDSLTEAGAVVHQAVTDVGGGKRIASVRDGDGNLTGLMQNP